MRIRESASLRVRKTTNDLVLPIISFPIETAFFCVRRQGGRGRKIRIAGTRELANSRELEKNKKRENQVLKKKLEFSEMLSQNLGSDRDRLLLSCYVFWELGGKLGVW